MGVPLWLGELRIQHGHGSSLGHCCGVRLIHDLELKHATDAGGKKNHLKNRKYEISVDFWELLLT